MSTGRVVATVLSVLWITSSCLHAAEKKRARTTDAASGRTRMAVAGPGRYFASLSDGSHIKGHKLSTRQTSSAARLDGKVIADKHRKLRSLIDRSLARFETTAAEAGFVEMVGGDRLPGRVVGYTAGDGRKGHNAGLLRVETPRTYGLSSGYGETYRGRREIRVRAGEVRRVAMTATDRPYQPSTLVERDGRRTRFLGVRLGDRSVQLLLAGGVRAVAWSDIADVHLPRQDSGEAYCRQLAAMDASLSQPIVRVETVDGLIATGGQRDEKVHVDRSRAEQLVRDRQRLERSIARMESSLAAHERTRVAREKKYKAVIDDLAKRGIHVEPEMEHIVATHLQHLVRHPHVKSSARITNERIAATIRALQEPGAAKNRWLKQANDRRLRGREVVYQARIDEARRQLAELPGSPDDPINWYQRVQPAWTPDALWVSIGTIRRLLIHEAHEPPLTRFLPAESSRPASLGPPRAARVDANVNGGPLRGGGQFHGWGIGVHAPHVLRFDLPAEAVSIRTRVGLDYLAGKGGCVRAAIYVGDDARRRLWRSGHLVGSSASADSGAVGLPAGTGNRSVVLVAESAHEDRPPGADPLNIRDFFNWVEPVVVLDRKALARRVAKAAGQRLRGGS